MDRAELLAALPRAAQRLFEAVERTISDGGGPVGLSYDDFTGTHGVDRKSLPPSLRMLRSVGLVEVEIGARGIGVYSISDCWRSIDAEQAARLIEVARQPQPQGARSSRPPKVKQAKTVKVRRRARAVPSLPVLSCLQEPN